MENRRMILVALLGLVLFLMYSAWQKDYGRPAASTPPAAASSSSGTNTAAAAPGADASPAAAQSQQSVRVQTDVLVAQIGLAGGELRRLELSNYAADKKHPEQKLALLDDQPDEVFVLQSGLASADAPKPIAGGRTVFSSPQAGYKLADGADGLDVPLEYSDASGYTVRKVFHFQRGGYEIGLKQTLLNKSGHALQAAPYLRLRRSPPPPDSSPGFMRTAGSFYGVGICQSGGDSADNCSFKKTAFKKIDDNAIDLRQTGGWITMLQHYFVAAIVPPQDQKLQFSASRDSNGPAYVAQYAAADLSTVADGAERSFDDKLYIGPVQQGAALEAVTPRFYLVEDYGILSPVAKPLFWVLTQYHKLTGNWGWSIILLTLTVKALFFKLSEAQYRSTAKMKKFGPRIQELRERFGEDRERLNKAMMELYKKEGFNPLAGCWPLLVQMPVFFALYWVLNQSVELRQAPFVLWMQDLSGPDPFYILPVLYGVSMWAQQRISG
ncbi:MAG: membrane protein insertase YidC, partial [Nevskia sp.]|nr:membrane protein insertase YidC [Nevskia sp.]